MGQRSLHMHSSDLPNKTLRKSALATGTAGTSTDCTTTALPPETKIRDQHNAATHTGISLGAPRTG